MKRLYARIALWLIEPALELRFHEAGKRAKRRIDERLAREGRTTIGPVSRGFGPYPEQPAPLANETSRSSGVREC